MLEESRLATIAFETRARDMKRKQELDREQRQTVAQVHSSAEGYSQVFDDDNSIDSEDSNSELEESNEDERSLHEGLDLNESLPIKEKPKSILEWSKSDVEQQNSVEFVKKKKSNKDKSNKKKNLKGNSEKPSSESKKLNISENMRSRNLKSEEYLQSSENRPSSSYEESVKSIEQNSVESEKNTEYIEGSIDNVTMDTEEEVLSAILNSESNNEAKSMNTTSVTNGDTIDATESLDMDDKVSESIKSEITAPILSEDSVKENKDEIEIPNIEQNKSASSDDRKSSSKSIRLDERKSSSKSNRSSKKLNHRNVQDEHPKSSEAQIASNEAEGSPEQNDLKENNSVHEEAKNLSETGVDAESSKQLSEESSSLIQKNVTDAEKDIDPGRPREDGDGSSITSLNNSIIEIEKKIVAQNTNDNLDVTEQNNIDDLVDSILTKLEKIEEIEPDEPVETSEVIREGILKKHVNDEPKDYLNEEETEKSNVINIEINGRSIKKILMTKSAEEEEAALNSLSNKVARRALNKGKPVSAIKQRPASQNAKSPRGKKENQATPSVKSKHRKRRVTYQDPIADIHDIRSHEILLTAGTTGGLDVRDAAPLRRKVGHGFCRYHRRSSLFCTIETHVYTP